MRNGQKKPCGTELSRSRSLNSIRLSLIHIYKSTEESSDADSVKMVKDYKGQDYGRCQTGEIKGCLDLVILFMQKFRQIPRKNIGRDNRQQAVVGEADAEAHQKKSGEKADHIQRQNIWQQGNPGIVYIDHFSESDADNKRRCV